jgi:secreted trypsin-like serine protease
VIGYGFTVSGGPVSSDLRKVDVSVLTDDVCTSFFGDYYNSSIMVCAGDPNKSACDGDSGGKRLGWQIFM